MRKKIFVFENVEKINKVKINNAKMELFKNYLNFLNKLEITHGEVMLKRFFMIYFTLKYGVLYNDKFYLLYKKKLYLECYEKYYQMRQYVKKKYRLFRKKRYMYLFNLLYIYFYKNSLLVKLKLILYRLKLFGFNFLYLKLKYKLLYFFYKKLKYFVKKKKINKKKIYKNNNIKFYLFLKFTLNNIFVYVYDLNLKKSFVLTKCFYTKYFYLSLGKVGFEGPSKEGKMAAFRLGLRFSSYLLKNKIYDLNIILFNKPNLRYKEFVKGLLFNNRKIPVYKFRIKIHYIYLMPKIAHNGCRLKKRRRV